MAEIESVKGKILSNLVSTFDGMTIPYDGSDHTATSEYLRLIEDNSDYPYIVSQFSNGNPLSESAGNTLWDLQFFVHCYIGNINDQKPANSIGKILNNAHAYLVQQVMTDTTRGGTALHTRIGRFGEVIVQYPDYEEFDIWVELFIKVFTDTSNPFTRTG